MSNSSLEVTRMRHAVIQKESCSYCSHATVPPETDHFNSIISLREFLEYKKSIRIIILNLQILFHYYQYLYLLRFATRNIVPTTTAINSATTMEYQIPFSPRISGRNIAVQFHLQSAPSQM